MDVSLNDAADQLFEGEIEVEQFTKGAAMGELIGDTAAGFSNLSDEFDWRNVWIISLFPNVAQQALEIAIELASRAVNRGFEIRARMTCLENFQEVPEIMQQTIFQVA